MSSRVDLSVDSVSSAARPKTVDAHAEPLPEETSKENVVQLHLLGARDKSRERRDGSTDYRARDVAVNSPRAGSERQRQC